MKSYRHILVLIHDERDGLPLLRQTVAMVRGLPIAITVGHLNADYAELGTAAMRWSKIARRRR